jgi:hypothetical protein
MPTAATLLRLSYGCKPAPNRQAEAEGRAACRNAGGWEEALRGIALHDSEAQLLVLRCLAAAMRKQQAPGEEVSRGLMLRVTVRWAWQQGRNMPPATTWFMCLHRCSRCMALTAAALRMRL